MPADGSDFTEALLPYQDANRIKNNYRGSTIPANIRPGMLFSRNTDNRLTHKTDTANYLIFQGEPVCYDNQVVCANNKVVVVLPV